MKDAESPRTLFEAIYVHWPEPPEVVVYDNSCHAMTYALNREPAWFKPVQWVIDATHFPGHTGCAYAFDIKRQPRLSRLNSQICEQRVRLFCIVAAIVQCMLRGTQKLYCCAEFKTGIGAEAVCFHGPADISSVYSVLCAQHQHHSKFAMKVVHRKLYDDRSLRLTTCRTCSACAIVEGCFVFRF